VLIAEGVAFRDRSLVPIWEKVLAGDRLDFEDGVTLLRTVDLPALGRMADHVARARNGDRVQFVVNRQINPTNLCVLSCVFCDFAAKPGDAHAYDPHLSKRGWWQSVIGPGEAIDVDRYFVVCANVLGGCQGSTGPASLNPATGRRWAASFPPVTIRDMVRTQARLADHLGVKRWLCVVGGSMGGMQALEWGAMYPARVRSIAPLAVGCSASPWQIGWSAVGRAAIAMDPRWRGGEYYDAEPGDGPHEGLALARAVAQITYRSDELFAERFGRSLVRPNEQFGLWDRFGVEGYLDYHGEKLVRRFDANTYLLLNKSMDTHDIGRGRGGLQRAVARIAVPVLTVSISSDTLYPPRQQTELRDLLVAADGDCRYVLLESPHGHDGFLVETRAVSAALAEFLESVEKDHTAPGTG